MNFRATCMRVFQWSSQALSTAEKTALLKAVAAYQCFILANERNGTASDYSDRSCQALLDTLSVAAEELNVEKEARGYRTAFSKNYKVLFHGERRQYRMDILEANIERYVAIWVNGEKFEFSPKAVHHARSLQEAWGMLTSLLDFCGRSQGEPQCCTWLPRPVVRNVFGRLPRPVVRNVFGTFDSAWARFEHQYVSELMDIEVKARRSLIKAVEAEANLQQHEGSRTGLPSGLTGSKEQENLVWCISQLNSLANHRRKGCDDLGVGVLHHAIAILRQCDEAEAIGKSTQATAAARFLANSVIESFDAMRRYLRNVAKCLHRVDPQLRNNAGLVQCLVDWELSWEVGIRYIQDEEVLNSFTDLVAHIQQVQCLVPAFAAMSHNFEPEFFMVLPRLIWLQVLKSPERHSKLMESLLHVQEEELNAFKEEFLRLVQEFAALLPRRPGMGVEAADWDLLTKQAVFGFAEEPCGMLPEHGEPVCRALEELVHAVEPWSIKLQRHRPEDWNQFVSTVTECLNNTNPAIRQVRVRAEKTLFQT